MHNTRVTSLRCVQPAPSFWRPARLVCFVLTASRALWGGSDVFQVWVDQHMLGWDRVGLMDR